MNIKRKIFGAPFDKTVYRIRDEKGDLKDKAALITDDTSQEKQVKFKSDGKVVPKPGDDKIGYMYYKKWYHSLLMMPEQRMEYFIFFDYGDGDGDFAEIDENENRVKAAGNERMFQTHRDFVGKKTLEIFSKDDNTEVWLAAYLSILVIINLAGMYVITQGVESGVASAVAKGIEAGIGAGSDAAGGSNIPGVGMILVGGRALLNKVRKSESARDY